MIFNSNNYFNKLNSINSMPVLGQLYTEAQNLRRFFTIFPKVDGQ